VAIYLQPGLPLVGPLQAGHVGEITRSITHGPGSLRANSANSTAGTPNQIKRVIKTSKDQENEAPVGGVRPGPVLPGCRRPSPTPTPLP
jgi:hypothetical protein